MDPKLRGDYPGSRAHSLSTTETSARDPAASSTNQGGLAANRRHTHAQSMPWPLRKVAFAIFTFVYIGLATAGVAYLSATRGSRGRSPQQCEDSNPVSTVESQFEIDLVFIDELSFTQAKLIDLAWDITVGHGGRLLHGWLFYYVACRVVTWILEHYSLHYWLLLDILFRPDSLSSLISLAKSIFRRQQLGTLMMLILLSYGIGHVIIFGTLWSASTGYQRPSMDIYIMPDGSRMTFSESSNLTLCWLLDGELSDLHLNDNIVLGPELKSVVSSFSDLEFDKIWNQSRVFPVGSPPKSTDDARFHDIYACKSSICLSLI